MAAITAMAARAAMAVMVVLVATEAGAQFGEYTPPGGPGTERFGLKEEVERSLEDARWRLGPIRLSPWFGLRQIGYVDNVFAGNAVDDRRVSDLTAVAGAGLTAFLPTGPDVVWTVDARPEYVWWRDLSERNQLTGRYGAGVFAFFNRLELQATAGREEGQGVASSEFPQLTVTRTDRVDASGRLRLGGKTDLSLAASWSEYSNQSDVLNDPRVPLFAQLDRRERLSRAAIGYQLSRRTRIALGIEHSQTDSLASRDLSSSGTAPTLDLRALGGRTTLDLHLARRSLNPRGGSTFVPYRAWNGDFQATVTPKARLAYQLYGSVQPSLSLSTDYTAYEQRRLGIALHAPLSRRLAATLFAESGQNRYAAVVGAPPRRDDTASYGIQLEVELARSLTFSLRASRDSIVSSLPGIIDRTTTSVQTGLTLTSSRLLWR